jgi:hypothetical protein
VRDHKCCATIHQRTHAPPGSEFSVRVSTLLVASSRMKMRRIRKNRARYRHQLALPLT